MLYIILRGQCVIVLSVHAPTEDKSDDTKDSFMRNWKYHMKFLLGDFNAKLGRQGISKPTIGNKSLHKINNYNGVTVVIFSTSEICQEYNIPTSQHA